MLLVTHALEYLPACDNIVVIEKGMIQDQGSYTHVSANQNGVLAGLLKAQKEAKAQSVSPITPLSPLSPIESEGVEKLQSDSVSTSMMIDDQTGTTDGVMCDTTITDVSADIPTDPTTTDPPTNDSSTTQTGELITEETRITGTVNRSVYSMYFAAAGSIWLIVLIFVLFLLSQAVRAVNNWWLTYWSRRMGSESDLWYVGIYTLLVIATVIATVVAHLILFLTALKASRKLHDGLLQGIMRSPMSFFDQTPLGRITNRISKDIYTVDQTIPSVFDSLLSCLFSVLATLVVILIATPWFIIVLIPLSFYYLYEQRFYIHSSREIKRLDSISRSPIYANFGETLDGTSVIRAYEAQPRFIEKNYALLDNNQRAYFIISSANCWLGLRLEFAGTIIIGAAVLLAVLGKDPMNATFTAMAAMAISYSLDTTQSLNWVVRMATEMETQIVAVERIEEYTDLPSEAPAHIPETAPDPSWPTHGDIQIEELTMRYRPELEPILKHLNLHINPGEKVGVVGRTGAGKSSLVLCLMRIIELESGRIVIDGVDIKQLGLEDLRSHIAIIPQEPLLFSGTVRSNLDPFSEYSDESIWSALDRASMRTVISEAPAGLDTPVEEHGSNYSVGQR